MARKDAATTAHNSRTKRRDSMSPRRQQTAHHSLERQRGSMDSRKQKASAADDARSRGTSNLTTSSTPPSGEVGTLLDPGAKVFEPRTADAKAKSNTSGRAASEGRFISSAPAVCPHSIVGVNGAAPYYTGVAGEWLPLQPGIYPPYTFPRSYANPYYTEGSARLAQVWQESQKGWNATDPFAHQLLLAQEHDGRSKLDVLRRKTEVMGNDVEVYLGETFVQKVSLRLLLRFSAVARRILDSRPRGDCKRISLRATSDKLPSMKALLEVVHWMQSTTPQQTDKDLDSFGSARVESLAMTDLLDMYTATCTFELEPLSAWQRLWAELTRRIEVRPPLVTALQTFHDCLCNSNTLMRLLLTRAYEGYRTREYTVKQWLAVKAYLLDSNNVPFRSHAVSAFNYARGHHQDVECIECVTDAWRVMGRGEVEARHVDMGGLYCAQHLEARSTKPDNRPSAAAHDEDVSGTIHHSLESTLSGGESGPVSKGRRRCRRAQQRRGKDLEAARTDGKASMK